MLGKRSSKEGRCGCLPADRDTDNLVVSFPCMRSDEQGQLRQGVLDAAWKRQRVPNACLMAAENCFERPVGYGYPCLRGLWRQGIAKWIHYSFGSRLNGMTPRVDDGATTADGYLQPKSLAWLSVVAIL